MGFLDANRLLMTPEPEKQTVVAHVDLSGGVAALGTSRKSVLMSVPLAKHSARSQ